MGEIIKSYMPVFPCRAEIECQPMFVLTQDVVGQFKVYVGIVQLPNPEHPNYDQSRKAAESWVHAHGAPLTWRQAVGWFPFLPEEEYRA